MQNETCHLYCLYAKMLEFWIAIVYSKDKFQTPSFNNKTVD